MKGGCAVCLFEGVPFVTNQPIPKHKILIADDSEMNRAILAEMLEREYEIVEAENGVQAVMALQTYGTELSLVLLDIVMPEMDGFSVLKVMNQRHWIGDIPVIMISSEQDASHVERAYELGVTDFIGRPFDAMVVHHRVVNTILLYAKQKRLMGLVADQVYEKEQQSTLMIDILSHIVEFRNGESGLHVLHIRILTELFLNHLVQKTDRYSFTPAEISLISVASSLHDIGKIAIPSEILNKPGKLTEEEFTLMKTHTTVGASMLEDLPVHQKEPLIRTAYEICRWHHERYDGRGYPDGLKGDEIPISAQIVALADVYDALTSERVYKKAFSHETALKMIFDGQCGAFHPLLLECLSECSDQIWERMNVGLYPQNDRQNVESITEELLQRNELTASERTLRLLEHERMKYSFFAAMSQELQFEYTKEPPTVTLSSWGAEHFGLPELILNPRQDPHVLNLASPESLDGLTRAIQATSPEQPVTQYDCIIRIHDEPRWVRFVCRSLWSTDEPPQYTGVIGKAVDIHEARLRNEALEHQASHDELTGLLEHSQARKEIEKRLQAEPNHKFILAILDLDSFKSANDTYGHLFGNRVLSYAAERLRQSVPEEAVTARIVGDDFLLFWRYEGDGESAVERVFTALSGGSYEGFPVSFRMGAAQTDAAERDYDALFHAADQALHAAKQGDGQMVCLYRADMENEPQSSSPIR